MHACTLYVALGRLDLLDRSHSTQVCQYYPMPPSGYLFRAAVTPRNESLRQCEVFKFIAAFAGGATRRE